MQFSRRQWLGGVAGMAAACGAGLAYGVFVEPRWPELVHLEIPSKWIGSGQRLRVLHLSDLHASPAVPLEWLDAVFQTALAEQPHVICLTGDYVTEGSSVDRKVYQQVLAKLPKAAPTIASMGNHDGGKWGKHTRRRETSAALRAMLTGAGIQVPHNGHAALSAAGVSLDVVGLGDLWAKEFDVNRGFHGLSKEAGRLRIVMSHNPDTKDIVQYFSWELLLCGHTHGGQVVLPLVGAPILPILDRQYSQGLFEYQGRRMYVTRGVGGVLGGLRINCRPEITLLDLVPGESPVELTEDRPYRNQVD